MTIENDINGDNMEVPYIHDRDYEIKIIEDVKKRLLTEYSWNVVSTIGNEDEAWILRYFDSDVRLSSFKSFISIKMAIGHVKHLPWENRTPIGTEGFISAVSSVAIWDSDDPEYKHDERLRWRITSLYPNSRTLFRNNEREPDGVIGLGREILISELLDIMYSMKPILGSKFEQSPIVSDSVSSAIDGW